MAEAGGARGSPGNGSYFKRSGKEPPSVMYKGQMWLIREGSPEGCLGWPNKAQAVQAMYVFMSSVEESYSTQGFPPPLGWWWGGGDGSWKGRNFSRVKELQKVHKVTGKQLCPSKWQQRSTKQHSWSKTVKPGLKTHQVLAGCGTPWQEVPSLR